MKPTVDILIANQNTLPWLKLLVSQCKRFKPELVDTSFFVWDNASDDGSKEWLTSSGIRHHLCDTRRAHYDGLLGGYDLTSAPYVTYMDVDAIPVAAGWLDAPWISLQHPIVGAAGLSRQLPWGERREFVHPSFCIFRRDLYDRLSLSPVIVHTKDFSYDVGELMCSKIQDNGHSLAFFGPSHFPHGDNLKACTNKVFHTGSACGMLCDQFLNREAVKQIAADHQRWLRRFGLWEEFTTYLRESKAANSLCERYLSLP
jgi:hypothetical protein